MNTTTTATGVSTTPVIVVKSDVSVVKAISSYFDAEAKAEAATAKAEGGYLNIAQQAIPVMAREGYTTREHVRQLLLLSFFEQAGVANGTEEEKASVEIKRRADVSNLAAIILPVPKKDSGKTAKELIEGRDACFKYNSELPANAKPNLRIGQKSVLDVVRGLESADYVIGVKKGTIAPKTAAAKATPTAATTVTDTNGSATPEKGATGSAATAATPGQQAETPLPEGQAIVRNPVDAMRNLFRQMLPNFITNHGLEAAIIVATAREEIEAFAKAKGVQG